MNTISLNAAGFGLKTSFGCSRSHCLARHGRHAYRVLAVLHPGALRNGGAGLLRLRHLAVTMAGYYGFGGYMPSYPTSFGRPAFMGGPVGMSAGPISGSIYGSMPSVPSIYASALAAPKVCAFFSYLLRESLYSCSCSLAMTRARTNNVQATTSAASSGQHSIYSSMVSMPMNNALYASQSVGPSIYASMPSMHSPPKKADPVPAKDDFPSLPEGFSTVGLMLWPGKNNELLVTGFMEGHSAEVCGIEIGDVIIRVDDTSVEGMPGQFT